MMIRAWLAVIFLGGGLVHGQDIGPATQPTKPQIIERIHARLDAIQTEVDRREKSNPQAAKMLAKDLQNLRDVLASKPSPDAPAETHALLLPALKNPQGNAIVEVTAGNRPIVLFLSGQGIKWQIKLDEGANLQRVVLCASDDSQITWADPAHAVPVEEKSLNRGERIFVFTNTPQERAEITERIEGLTGAKVAGIFQAPWAMDGPFVIGQGSMGWYEELDRSQVEPLYREATAIQRAHAPANEASQVFKAVHYDLPAQPPPRIINGRQLPMPMPNLDNLPGMLTDCTAYGFIDGAAQKQTEFTHIAFDPPFYYGIHFNYRNDDEALYIDDPSGHPTAIPIKGDVPKMHALNGIAFDSKRGRLVVSSAFGSGNVGHICAYYPKTQTWLFLRDLPQYYSTQSLVYSPAEDCFYCIQPPEGGPNYTRIRKLDADCNDLGVVDMSEPIAPIHGPTKPSQMAIVGENLAIIVPPRAIDLNGQQIVGEQCMLVNPRTGYVMSITPMQPRPIPAADFTSTEFDSLWNALGDENADQAGKAANRLIAGSDKAVEAFDVKLHILVQPLSDEQIKDLFAKLDSNDSDVREQATNDLIDTGPQIVSRLKDSLAGDISPEARVRQERILHDITMPDETNLTPKFRRQSRLINVLQQIGTAAAIERLIELSALEDSRPQLARDAKAALRAI